MWLKIWTYKAYRYACSTEETFLQDCSNSEANAWKSWRNASILLKTEWTNDCMEFVIKFFHSKGYCTKYIAIYIAVCVCMYVCNQGVWRSPQILVFVLNICFMNSEKKMYFIFKCVYVCLCVCNFVDTCSNEVCVVMFMHTWMCVLLLLIYFYH